MTTRSHSREQLPCLLASALASAALLLACGSGPPVGPPEPDSDEPGDVTDVGEDSAPDGAEEPSPSDEPEEGEPSDPADEPGDAETPDSGDEFEEPSPEEEEPEEEEPGPEEEDPCIGNLQGSGPCLLPWELYRIDGELLFLDEVSTCTDMARRSLWSGCPHVGVLLCDEVTTVAGPERDCASAEHSTLFATILANPADPNLGLGPEHEVVRVFP